MTSDMEHDTCPEQPRDLLEIKDVGAATAITRGSPELYPWYEIGPPPYNHYCPIC
jgi:hypothetical protein